MPFKKNNLLLFCALLFLPHFARAAGHTSRTVTDAQWQQLTDKSFDYKNDIENIPAPKNFEPNLFQKMIARIIDFFGNGAGNVLMWLLLTGIVIYIIYRLFFSSDSFLFGRNKKVMEMRSEEGLDEENIISTDWETLLQNAAAKKDFRLAVRYSYMWILQLFQLRGLILYRTDKTNSEYYNELNGTGYKQTFRQLSRQYEYTWYGRFEISEITYREYLGLFNELKNSVSPR